jgi:hypothetical protein
MALQDGFKILELTVWDGGGGYQHQATGSLTMRAPGSHSIGVGSGFEGRYYVSDPNAGVTDRGIIYSASIQSKGKNYSSGSWNIDAEVPAALGEFVSVGILGTGSGSIILPRIGQDTSMSFADINVERGLAANTANSDIHDLYEDFSSIAGTVNTDLFGKPNFDWWQGGPKSASASHPIRLDEFYGTNYSQYGGTGCLGLETPITMADGSTKNIEDLNVGEWVRAATIPGMPLDFDEEDTWSIWEGIPHGNPPSSVWATAYYDIQEINRVTPASASIQEIYFDYYDNYYLINGSLKATYEHPFFILRDGRYHFKTTVSLRLGDKLFKTNNEFEEISSIEFVNEPLETVNFNVENLDVYFGGGYLMHNVHGK